MSHDVLCELTGAAAFAADAAVSVCFVAVREGLSCKISHSFSPLFLMSYISKHNCPPKASDIPDIPRLLFV